MLDKAGIAVNTAGSAAHAARSTGHILAHSVDTELHPNMGSNSRSHILVPERREYLRQTNTKR